MRALAGAWMVVAAAGCVPMYLAPGSNLAMQQRRQDVHLGAGVGFEGVHLRGQYGLSDRWGARAEVSASNVGRDSYRRFGQLGLGYTYATGGPKEGEEFPSGLRTGAQLDLGLGDSKGSATFSGLGSQTTYHYAAHLLRLAPEGFIGYEWKYFALALSLRLSMVHFTAAPGNQHADPQSTVAFWEPILMVRAGPAPVKVDVQFGLSLPLAGRGNIGGLLPFIVSLGLVTDFNLQRTPARPPPSASR